MNISSALIPRRIFFTGAFADLIPSEKLLYLTAVVFADPKGKISVTQKALAGFSGIKQYQKHFKTLVNKKLIMKENLDYFIENYDAFSVEKKGMLTGFENVLTLSEPAKRRIYEEYNKSIYKFQYWKETIFEELDYLEQSGYPLEWAKGITHKIYLYLKEKRGRVGDFTFSKKFISVIARNTTNSSIINNFPPPFPTVSKRRNEAKEELDRMKKLFGKEVSYG